MYKILVVSHGHPDFRIGGGEKAAYFLYKGYSEIKEKIQKAYFLTPSHIKFDGRIEYYKENEYFWNTKMTDFFFVKSETLFLPIIRDFLETIKPDIVHLHHYLFLGLEFIKAVKKFIPNVRILLTLHEYIPICYNNGQMIKRYDNTLCYESNIEACHKCFPEIPKEWFFLRNHRFMRYFDYIDYFIAPSNFLKSRFIEWGLPEEKNNCNRKWLP